MPVKYKNALIVLCMFVLLVIAGLRYNVGTDYPHYASNYYYYCTEPLELFKNPGVAIIAKLCSVTINDYSSWFFLMSLITILPVLIIILKYSIDPVFSVVLYVLLGCWHFSFNLVKQSAAASILLLGIGFLINRNLFSVYIKLKKPSGVAALS